MLTQQSGHRGCAIEPANLDPFVSRLLARDDADVAAGKVERVREEGDEGVVSGALDWRRGEPNQDGVAPPAIHAAAGRARDDANVEVSSKLFVHQGWRRGSPSFSRPHPTGADGGSGASRRSAPDPDRA